MRKERRKGSKLRGVVHEVPDGLLRADDHQYEAETDHKRGLLRLAIDGPLVVLLEFQVEHARQRERNQCAEERAGEGPNLANFLEAEREAERRTYKKKANTEQDKASSKVRYIH